LLRYVWLADGRLANLELVAGGYAYEYTYDQPYTYQQTFKQAQRDAQTARRGLWSPTTCNGAREAAATTASAPTAGQGAPAPPAGCSARPDPARAPNAPVAIVAVDKRAEVVTLKNVGDTPVDLGGWTLCSLRGAQTHPIGGVLAPGETKAFPGAPGAAIWSNGDRDDGALYDAQGRLISYWRDG
ncbi:MAG TPA: lamin tail domain-containing protein, partial [Roseiflexaceae bacterium]